MAGVGEQSNPYKPSVGPVLLPGDHHGIQNPHEMDSLLHRPGPMAPLNLDPYNKGSSLSRPTPAYQRRTGQQI